MVIEFTRDENSPKYIMVEDYVKKYIEVKKLKNGDLLPTENELAEELDIHANTVKHGLNNLVKEGIIFRERGKGTFVSSPGKFTTTDNHTIGIIVEDLFKRSELCSAIVRGIDDVVSEKNISYFLGNSDNEFEKIKNYLNQFFERSVSGVILMPLQSNTEHENNYKIIEMLKKNDVPVVLVNRYLKGFAVDYVVSNNENGGFISTEYFIKNGHKKIAYIIEPFCSTIEERLVGYKLALARNGLEYNEALVVVSDNRLEEAGVNGVETLFERGVEFTAIFCSNDSVAKGAYETLGKKGLSVPDDVSLIGYDDTPEAQILPVSLSTVSQPAYNLGKEAAKLLLKRINDPDKEYERIILESKLIIRDSVKAIV